MCSTRARKAVAGTPVERGHGGLCGSGLVLVKPATSRAEGRGYVGVGHPHLRPAVGHVQDGARGRGAESARWRGRVKPDFVIITAGLAARAEA
jgi:hypothetical protein